MPDPLLSIITVSYNSLDGLIATNASLPRTVSGEVESIVIDSLSTDGTAEFLASAECHYTRVIREKDSGIYDAMNKGIRAARGRYLLFMNCGDRLAADLPWARLQRDLESEPAVWIGDLRLDNGGFARVEESAFTYWHLVRFSLPHQASMIPRDFIQVVGGYNEVYQISADQEWFLRALTAKLPFRALGYTVAWYVGGGVSERPQNVSVLQRERRTMLTVHLGLLHALSLRFRVTLHEGLTGLAFWMKTVAKRAAPRLAKAWKSRRRQR